MEQAISEYLSTNIGAEAQAPNITMLRRCKHFGHLPIIITYKGCKNRLLKRNKQGLIENRTSKYDLHFKNINSYAVNASVYYANALLHHTNHTDILAIGVAGYKDSKDAIHHEIGVYYVSKDNFGLGQEVGKHSDLSFVFRTKRKKLP